jgi:hypothetical protein
LVSFEVAQVTGSEMDTGDFDKDDMVLDKFVEANPLFQSREVKELDTGGHIPPRCTFSFNDDDYFKEIPMFLNPYYEYSLHYNDHISERNIPRDNINLFDEFIDHLFDIQTLNPKPDVLDSINTFSIK